jgi:hypothetical protein
LKLFIDAQASISVPSTEKWSVLKSRFTRGCAKTALRKFAAISPFSSRSRFLENTEWSHAASSTPRPTNQWNNRSNSSSSINCRSERIEWNACSSIRSQQFLRRDRRPPNRRIKRRKIARQRCQSLVHNHADRAQRMALANPSFKIDITEKRSRPLVLASHEFSPRSRAQKTESRRD